jgi:hypothetical protein
MNACFHHAAVLRAPEFTHFSQFATGTQQCYATLVTPLVALSTFPQQSSQQQGFVPFLFQKISA